MMFDQLLPLTSNNQNNIIQYFVIKQPGWSKKDGSTSADESAFCFGGLLLSQLLCIFEVIIVFLLLMHNQKLEELIQRLKHDHAEKPNATIKRLRPVLKAFNEYSTTADTLPPPTLIPICLFVLPKLFRSLLGLAEGEVLEEQPQKSGVRLCLHLYLKGLLRLLGESDEQIKHVVVQSMVQNMELVRAYPQLCRKWIRALVQIWATNSQNLNLSLRCFMALEKALRSGNDQFYIWGLRRMYVGYFQNSGQVTWRTLEHINFMGNCFCQVLRINPVKAYYVLFGYIRTIAMQVQSLNNCKGKQKQEITSKLYSMQILQAFRLLGQAVGKSGQQQLSGLTYPLAELISAYERISQSPEYLTLKLHVVQIELQLMENTGLYLPHVLEALLKILRCGPLHKKHSRKAGVEGSIELGYKLTPQELKNTNILNDIFDKTLFYVHWLIDLSFKTVGGVELAKHISRLIQSVELGYVGHRKNIKAAVKIFLRDADKVEQARSKRKMALGDKAVQKFQNVVLAQGKLQLQSHQSYLNILQQRQSLFKAKVLAQQEDNRQDRGSQNEQEVEDQDELESGWEEASEGASQLDQAELKSKESEEEEEQMEDISYSGDPEDVSEAIKEWSQHEWSSQEQVEA